MSTKLEASFDTPTGCPELTELGKRIEWLRIERGLSKQYLARYAGTSRQQLWRVMTGKSELTSALRQRLADVLLVETAALAGDAVRWNTPLSARTGSPARSATAAGPAVLPPSFEQYAADDAKLEHSLRALPTGALGRRLKRALLNAIEDVAVEHAVPLHAGFFELRRQVLAEEI
jgi:transcriptional regulator with XRE-family HTH domain